MLFEYSIFVKFKKVNFEYCSRSFVNKKFVEFLIEFHAFHAFFLSFDKSSKRLTLVKNCIRRNCFRISTQLIINIAIMRLTSTSEAIKASFFSSKETFIFNSKETFKSSILTFFLLRSIFFSLRFFCFLISFFT